MASSSALERITTLQASLPPQVRLIAVSKQVPVSAMRAAYSVGVRDFGESRIQEAEAKQAALADLPGITWHLIGHLQRNKAPKALQLFQWIHSVDSLELAERLNRLAASQARVPNICLQVKVLPDPTKFGWAIPDLLADLPRLDQCVNLNIRGLMAIPPANLPDPEILQVFQTVQALAQQIQQQAWQRLSIQELSMGMSGDYLLALQAGATMIRLGQSLFGSRSSPPEAELPLNPA